MSAQPRISVGGYIATRLRELGINQYFAIPGDYNLLLLDEMLKIPDLQQLYCCNELNAGYAADGYARARGLAAVVVTYSVGGLSTINAAAGAYAEDLPVIFVSGKIGDRPRFPLILCWPARLARCDATLQHGLDFRAEPRVTQHIVTIGCLPDLIDQFRLQVRTERIPVVPATDLHRLTQHTVERVWIEQRIVHALPV